jgi:hypothetical protein
MSLRKQEDTGNSKRKQKIAHIEGELEGRIEVTGR